MIHGFTQGVALGWSVGPVRGEMQNAQPRNSRFGFAWTYSSAMRHDGRSFFAPGVIVSVVVPVSTLSESLVMPGKILIRPPLGND
jgi:hypothetical protein